MRSQICILRGNLPFGEGMAFNILWLSIGARRGENQAFGHAWPQGSKYLVRRGRDSDISATLEDTRRRIESLDAIRIGLEKDKGPLLGSYP